MLTIVLLPGMDGTGELFAPFISAMGHEFGLTVVSYPPTGAQGYRELEAHARAALPRHERFVVLGESFSGPVAVSIAASHPAGFAGLILCSTFCSTPALRAALTHAMSQVSAQTLRSRLQAVLSVEVSDRLKAVDVPVLYLRATQDRVVPASASRHIKRILPTTRVAPVEAPHFLLQAAPVQATRIVSRFLRFSVIAPAL